MLVVLVVLVVQLAWQQGLLHAHLCWWWWSSVEHTHKHKAIKHQLDQLFVPFTNTNRIVCLPCPTHSLYKNADHHAISVPAGQQQPCCCTHHTRAHVCTTVAASNSPRHGCQGVYQRSTAMWAACPVAGCLERRVFAAITRLEHPAVY